MKVKRTNTNTGEGIMRNIYKSELEKYEAIEKHNDAILAANPDCPRYCYDCQCWLDNAAQAQAHPGHSVH